jgi:hypothetical protein
MEVTFDESVSGLLEKLLQVRALALLAVAYIPRWECCQIKVWDIPGAGVQDWVICRYAESYLGFWSGSRDMVWDGTRFTNYSNGVIDLVEGRLQFPLSGARHQVTATGRGQCCTSPLTYGM